ncbi:MAG: hypothetical protein QOJ16_4222 [Acidobacteriota bacterium]|nr:hypothetical protein [Acidobacteriota bacterium]
MGKTLKLGTMGMILALTLGLGRAVAFPIFIIGVAPQNPSDRDVVKLSFTLSLSHCLPVFETAIAGNRITLTGRPDPFPVAACLQAAAYEFPVGPLPAGSYTVDLVVEGAPLGTTTFRVRATDVPQGDLQPGLRLATPADPLRLTATVSSDCRVAFAPPTVSGDLVEIAASTATPCQNSPSASREVVTVGPLPAGAYTAELTIDGVLAATRALLVTDPLPGLSLLGGHFLVTVDRNGPGPSARAAAVPLGDESGYFWFFDSANLELTAKILDGRSVNGHFWFFLASMTDIPFTVNVYDLGGGTCAADLATCPRRTYVNPAGRNANFVDTSAFEASSPSQVGAAPVPAVHRLIVSPRLPTSADPVEVRVLLAQRCAAFDPLLRVEGTVIHFQLFTQASCPTTPISPRSSGSVGPLPAGLYTVEAMVDGVLLPVQRLEVTPATPSLSLLGGVELTLDWRLPGGGGTAHAVGLSSESGYFWFFDPKNAEVTAKLLDGQAVNGHLWLFLASMTDVAYTLKVVDRRSPDCALSATGCPTKTYTGEAGKNANLIDLNLF